MFDCAGLLAGTETQSVISGVEPGQLGPIRYVTFTHIGQPVSLVKSICAVAGNAMATTKAISAASLERERG